MNTYLNSSSSPKMPLAYKSKLAATQNILALSFFVVSAFALNARASIPDASSTSLNDLNKGAAVAAGVNPLIGKWMKLEKIQDLKTVGLDGTIYKASCSSAQVSNAFSFNSQQIGDAISSPILTSHPGLCARLDFNAVMYFPAESASAEKILGSPEEIVLAQVEGHSALKNLDEGKSTLHIVRGVKLKASCETHSRSKLLGMMSDTVMDCRISEGGTGTLTFVVN